MQQKTKLFYAAAVVFSLCCFFLVTPKSSHAQQQYSSSIYLLGGPDTGQFNRNIAQYGQLTEIPPQTTGFYSTRFRNGTNKEVVLNDIKAFINNNPSDSYMFVYGVHGAIGDGKQFTNGPLTKADFAYAVARALKETNTYGGLVMNCCGAGAIFDYTDAKFSKDDWSNLKYAIASSLADESGTTPDVGNKFNKIFSREYDLDHDGVITAGELIKGLEKTGDKNKDWRVDDPDHPIFELEPGAMKKYIIENYGFCGVVTPGEDDFGKPEQFRVFGDDFVCEYRDGKGCFGAPDIIGRPGQFEENKLNYDLRTYQGKGLGHLRYRNNKLSDNEQENHVGRATKTNYELMRLAVDPGYKERMIEWFSGEETESITEEQAREALGNDQHAYTVDGFKMPPRLYLKRTVATDANGKNVRITDVKENGRTVCKLTEAPKQIQPSPFPPGIDSPGGGFPPGGSQPGGQQPQQQPQQYQPGQNLICPDYYQPICGEDAKTYPNKCFASQANVPVLHEGACTEDDIEKKNKETVGNITDLLKQALETGIPANLLSGVIQTVAQLLMNFYIKGTVVTEIIGG